ncbi:MAG: alpha/beta hydrolase family protein, partial [Chitinispirillaceae bacterium]
MEYQKLITAFTSLLILNCTASSEENGRSVELLSDSQLKTFSSVAQSPLNRMPKRKAWKEAVPEAQWITIPSTADGTTQSAIFYDSENSRKRPLLVALHSWSSDYEKQFSIPFGVWAVKNDWVFIHPDYRGAYIDSESTASEYAIQDILDALEYAKNNANVDESRIYLTGFSGGGMTTLIMAGRFPQLWTAAAAWVPVYDLPQWYETTKRSRQTYAAHIENSCGGPPEPGTKAYRECKKRSVSTYLKNARNKEIQIFIATGIKD